MKLTDHHYFTRDLTRQYPVAAHGEGVYVWDTDGKRYLDACAGACVVGIGHGVTEVEIGRAHV